MQSHAQNDVMRPECQSAFDVLNGKKLSKVKKLLLRELLSAGDQFPREWLTSAHLLELSGQKYFDRRLRELRDENGLDLQSAVINGHHSWRLNSATVSLGNARKYLTSKQRSALFDRFEHKCAICLAAVAPGVRGLQADHKVPLSRGGTNELSNWQSLCNTCNVIKRRACQECDLDCQACSWAYPVENEEMLLLGLSPDLAKSLGLESLDAHERVRRIRDLLNLSLATPSH